MFNVTPKQTLPFILKQKQPLPSTTSDRHQLGDHLYAVGRIHNHKLSQEEKIAIASCSGRTTPIGTTVPAVGKLMKNHTLYHSLLHQRGGARNNTICMLTAEEQGFAVIEYFCLLSSTQPLAILQVFERTPKSILNSIRPPRTEELKVLTTAKQRTDHVIKVKSCHKHRP